MPVQPACILKKDRHENPVLLYCKAASLSYIDLFYDMQIQEKNSFKSLHESHRI
jgi:hypothetical protein